MNSRRGIGRRRAVGCHSGEHGIQLDQRADPRENQTKLKQGAQGEQRGQEAVGGGVAPPELYVHSFRATASGGRKMARMMSTTSQRSTLHSGMMKLCRVGAKYNTKAPARQTPRCTDRTLRPDRAKIPKRGKFRNKHGVIISKVLLVTLGASQGTWKSSRPPVTW